MCSWSCERFSLVHLLLCVTPRRRHERKSQGQRGRKRKTERKDEKIQKWRNVGLCVSARVLDLGRCCVSVDPRWSQNSTEHISPLGVFTHTFRHTQIFSVILLTVGSPEPLLTLLWQDFCSAGTVK